MPKLYRELERRLAKAAVTALVVAPTLVGCATTDLPPPEQRIDELDKAAMHSAVADGVSTGLALSAGAVEMNPMISTSPLGLVALTGAKIGLVKFADRLPKQQKRLVIKSASAVWGGAAVNNLMVLISATPIAAVGAGIIAGTLWWLHSSAVYEEADREIAAREQKLPLDTDRRVAAAPTPAPPPLPELH